MSRKSVEDDIQDARARMAAMDKQIRGTCYLPPITTMRESLAVMREQLIRVLESRPVEVLDRVNDRPIHNVIALIERLMDRCPTTV